MQFCECEQARQKGQPEVERTSIDDQRAAQQRAQMAVRQVVQVGAGALNEYFMRMRAKRQDGAADGKQNRHVPNGEPNPGQPGEDAPKH